MKYFLAVFAASLFALSSLAQTTYINQGTNVITITVNPSGGLNFTTNSQSQLMPTGNPFGDLITRTELALQQIGTATNWGFVAYGSIGAKSVTIGKTRSHAYGGGMLGIYNFTSFIGVGGGVDEIAGLGKGQLTLISANIQLQAPLQPLLFTGWSWATNFTVTPFLYSGIGTPLGGTSGQNAVTHEGEGINIDLISLGGWTLGGGVAYIERQNAGPYSQNYWNPEAAIHRPF